MYDKCKIDRHKMKALRKRKEWTQKRLAEITLLSRPYIHHIEMGIRNPSIRAIAIIAAALGVEIQEIILDESNSPQK